MRSTTSRCGLLLRFAFFDFDLGGHHSVVDGHLRADLDVAGDLVSILVSVFFLQGNYFAASAGLAAAALASAAAFSAAAFSSAAFFF